MSNSLVCRVPIWCKINFKLSTNVQYNGDRIDIQSGEKGCTDRSWGLLREGMGFMERQNGYYRRDGFYGKKLRVLQTGDG